MTFEHYQRLEEARNAVIEAAKALLVDNMPLQLRMDRLTDTVQTLLVAEADHAD